MDQLISRGHSPMELVYSTPSPDPRYYNLRWMQLLTEVRESLYPYTRVF